MMVAQGLLRSIQFVPVAALCENVRSQNIQSLETGPVPIVDWKDRLNEAICLYQLCPVRPWQEGITLFAFQPCIGVQDDGELPQSSGCFQVSEMPDMQRIETPAGYDGRN